LNIPIQDMTINGVAVTYVSGANFTITTGDSGNFTSAQLGTQTVIIYYGSSTAGQSITFTDSDNFITCHEVTGGSGSFMITGATITSLGTLTVSATDGACA
jgi:hypothetical protein